MSGQIGTVLGRVAEMGAGFLSAEVAIRVLEGALHAGAEAIRGLTTYGAQIAEVEANFDHLTAGASRLSDSLLGALREGTRHTIADFALMKIATTDLAAGMNLTDTQFRTLAEGARALAAATGTDVTTALETMNDAMLTGRTRALAMLTGKIDLEAAERKYAESLGTTRDRLTETGKLEAARAAILESVATATARLGTQTDGLGDLVAQTQTAWDNFYENLAKTVGTSPHVIGAFVAIRDAIAQAFGGDTQSIMQTAVKWIDAIADVVAAQAPTIIQGLERVKDWAILAFGTVKEWAIAFYQAAATAWASYGPIIVDGFVLLKDWILGTYHAVVDSWNALPTWLKTVAEYTAVTGVGMYTVGRATQFASSRFEDMTGTARNVVQTLAALPAAIGAVTHAIEGALAATQLWVVAYAGIATTIASVAAVVTVAYQAWQLWSENAGRAASDAKQLAVDQANLARASELAGRPITDMNEALALFRAHAAELRGELPALTQAQVDAAKTAEALAEQQRRIAEAFARTTDEAQRQSAATRGWTETEDKMLAQITQQWDEFFALKTAHSGTSFDAQRAQIEQWRQDQIAAIDYSAANWRELYQGINATADEKLAAIGSHWEELAAQSRESLQQTADAAFEDYDRMVESGLTFTHDVLDAQLEKARQLQQAATAMGGAYVDAYAKSKAAADELAGKQIKELERLQALKEANRALGGSMSVTAANLSERLSQAGLGGTELSAAGLAKEGYSFEEIVDFLLHSGGRPTHKPIGPRIPGYAEGILDAPGGRAVVGERGPELVTLPPHANVTPLGTAMQVTNHIYVNGTAADVARKVAEEIMRTLKQNHRFGSA